MNLSVTLNPDSIQCTQYVPYIEAEPMVVTEVSFGNILNLSREEVYGSSSDCSGSSNVYNTTDTTGSSDSATAMRGIDFALFDKTLSSVLKAAHHTDNHQQQQEKDRDGMYTTPTITTTSGSGSSATVAALAAAATAANSTHTSSYTVREEHKASAVHTTTTSTADEDHGTYHTTPWVLLLYTLSLFGFYYCIRAR